MSLSLHTRNCVATRNWLFQPDMLTILPDRCGGFISFINFHFKVILIVCANLGIDYRAISLHAADRTYKQFLRSAQPGFVLRKTNDDS